VENKQKLVQFVIVFNLLNKGKSMKNHEDFQVLFKFLRPQFVPQKHIIHELRKMTKVVVQVCVFHLNEVTSMDNVSYASVHGYVVQD
jgi:hypothetical protein